MSYEVKLSLNGQKFVDGEVSSYDAAKKAIKEGVEACVEVLATPVRVGLYRSPKVTARINADRLRSVENLVKNVKLPKTAGSVGGNVGSLSYSVVRR